MRAKILGYGLLAVTAACGRAKHRGDGGDSPNTSTPAASDAFTTPDYLDAQYTNVTLYDPSASAPNVAGLQKLGALIAAIGAKQGKITLDDGTVVALTAIARNDCPATASSCNDVDSATLKVADTAMVEDPTVLEAAIRDQGDRNSCVAFAVDAAMEILLHRAQPSAAPFDLSEQHTYFEGRAASGDWSAAGLSPASTISDFAQKAVGLSEESAWPFNAKQSSCDAYLAANPGAYCSATEAQGGGSDQHQPDPRTTSGALHHIKKAHQLYASLGRVKQALAKGYPVVLGVNANIDFNLATKKKGVISWIFKQAKCDGDVCGHAVLAVGYHDDPTIGGGGYVVIKNSWGQGWGAAGLGFVTYEWLQNSILDAQAIVSVD